MTLREATRDFQRKMILRVLRQMNGNKIAAARVLGLRRYDHLTQRMHRLGIYMNGRRGPKMREPKPMSAAKEKSESGAAVDRLMMLASVKKRA